MVNRVLFRRCLFARFIRGDPADILLETNGNPRFAVTVEYVFVVPPGGRSLRRVNPSDRGDGREYYRNMVKCRTAERRYCRKNI